MSSLLLAALLVAAAPAKPAPAAVTAQNCLISPIQHGEAKVPAKEPGVLIEVPVVEGQQVKAGELLGRIDDLEVQEAYKVAGFNWDVAKEEAASDVNVRYSVKAAAVAESEHNAALQANKRMPGTVPDAEVKRLKLTWDRSLLEIEKARMDQRIAGLKAKVKEAEAAVAYENVQRRHVRSPLDGVVVEIRGRQGEWAKPGDPVVHVIRFDRLRVEGFLNAADLLPGEIQDRPVTVVVRLARERVETFQGRVDFASPVVPAGHQFRVRAEVVNRQENGHWLLRPGLQADMTIHLR